MLKMGDQSQMTPTESIVISCAGEAMTWEQWCEYKDFLFDNFGIFHTPLAKWLAIEALMDEGFCGEQKTKEKE